MRASFHLRGKQETKEVSINDHLLKIGESSQVYTCAKTFDWGGIDGGCPQLGLSVCIYFLSFTGAVSHYRDFTKKVIAQIPRGDFEVKIFYDFEAREILELVNESTIKVKKTTKK